MSLWLLVLARQCLLSRNLLFRLLVSMRYQPVQKAPWPSLGVVLRLSLVDLTLQGTGRFVVDIVLIFDFVEVCCAQLAISRKTKLHIVSPTVLIMHRELPLDLLSDFLHGECEAGGCGSGVVF